MPTIAYPGGKARLAKQIISFLPKQGRCYVEPFVGRGNIFWAAACAGLKYDRWRLNDSATIPFFRAIKQIGHVIEVPHCARHEYERQRDAYNSGDSTAILLEPFLTFTGGGYLHSGFRGDKKGGVSSVGYQETLRECHRIMSRTRPRLSNLDWREMRLDELGPNDMVVVDPPYPDTNPLSYTDATVNYHELVDLLLRAKFRWVLCGYLHPALQRLGNPCWAKDVRFLYLRGEEARRTECLWTNRPDDVAVKRYSLPLALRGRLRTQNHASKLSFPDLDQKIDDGLETVAKDWSNLVPFLLEMNRRLSAPGRRTDLRKGAPAGLTWVAWVESKRSKLGRSLRSVQRLLRGKTEASKNWKARPHDILSSGSEKILPSAMGIAFEMARLILEMRSRSRNTTSNKRRLERLASQFLSVAERRSQQRSDSTSAERIGIANRTSSGVTLTM